MPFGRRDPSPKTRERVDAYLDFRSALRAVLATGDARQFRLFLRDSGEDLRDPELSAMGRWSEETLLPLMHRMVLADVKLAEHHGVSRQWLRERHLSTRVRPTGYGWGTELRQRYKSQGPRSRTA